MLLQKWEKLPDYMKNDSVRRYYDHLADKKAALLLKRSFDVLCSLLALIITFPFLLIIAVVIKIDSKGTVFYRQTRITSYGEEFKIFKFRTMVSDADKKGSLVTVKGDSRITRAGRFLRKVRLDELPQTINVLLGEMSFVGTRPEVKKYVERYTDEMMATLLMPAGITSCGSIAFKDEEQLLTQAESVDDVYVRQILPEKMKHNLQYIKEFSFLKDCRILLRTVAAMFGK